MVESIVVDDKRNSLFSKKSYINNYSKTSIWFYNTILYDRLRSYITISIAIDTRANNIFVSFYTGTCHWNRVKTALYNNPLAKLIAKNWWFLTILLYGSRKSRIVANIPTIIITGLTIHLGTTIRNHTYERVPVCVQPSFCIAFKLRLRSTKIIILII